MKPIRKWIALGLCVTLLAALAACGGEEDSSGAASLSSSVPASSASGSGSDETSAASGSVSGSGSAAGGASAVSSVPAPVEMNGSFYQLDEARYPEERAPLLELASTGRFTLRLNTSEFLAELAGSYLRTGTSLVLTIQTRDIEDYLGADIDELTFTVLDEDHLEYTGEPVGMLRKGDQFTRDGMLPLEKPESVPPPTPDSAPAGISGASGAASVASSKATGTSGETASDDDTSIVVTAP